MNVILSKIFFLHRFFRIYELKATAPSSKRPETTCMSFDLIQVIRLITSEQLVKKNLYLSLIERDHAFELHLQEKDNVQVNNLYHHIIKT